MSTDQRDLFGILGFLISVLVSIMYGVSFFWQCLFLACLIIFVTHACWCSRLIVMRPISRIGASVLLTVGILGPLANPLRVKWMAEHLQPSTAYVMPYMWVGDNWEMVVLHYGPAPAKSVAMHFRDRVKEKDVRNNPHFNKDTGIEPYFTGFELNYPEIDPNASFENRMFNWKPELNAQQQYYEVDIDSWDGDPKDVYFKELLAIEKAVDGRWAVSLLLAREPDGKILMYCKDPNFPPGAPPAPQFCGNQYGQHQGGAHLPLEFPERSEDRAMALFVCTFVALVLFSLYGVFAAWCMGTQDLLQPR
ncbi:MAG: hypothetical protein WAU82_11665 [Candidatus Binatus sp.]